jgi:hypothetical protein
MGRHGITSLHLGLALNVESGTCPLAYESFPSQTSVVYVDVAAKFQLALRVNAKTPAASSVLLIPFQSTQNGHQ